MTVCKRCGSTERTKRGDACRPCVNASNARARERERRAKALQAAWDSGKYVPQVPEVVIALLHKRWAA